MTSITFANPEILCLPRYGRGYHAGQLSQVAGLITDLGAVGPAESQPDAYAAGVSAHAESRTIRGSFLPIPAST